MYTLYQSYILLVPGISAAEDPTNLRYFHVLIQGSDSTPYAGMY